MLGSYALMRMTQSFYTKRDRENCDVHWQQCEPWLHSATSCVHHFGWCFPHKAQWTHCYSYTRLRRASFRSIKSWQPPSCGGLPSPSRGNICCLYVAQYDLNHARLFFEAWKSKRTRVIRRLHILQRQH